MTTSQYTYSRGNNGAYDTLEIRNPQGDVISSQRFWNDKAGIMDSLAEKAGIAICEHFNGWRNGEDPTAAESLNFVAYQLADDHVTYGTDAGKFIVTSADHEKEISSPMCDKDAKAFARLLDALQSVVNIEHDRDEESRNFDEERLEYFARLIAEATGRAA